MRTRQRISLTVLAAALVAGLPSGCAPLRGTLLAPNSPPAKPSGVATTDDIGGGTVVSAGAALPAQPVAPMPPPVPPAIPDPLGAPRPLPPVPTGPTLPGVPIDPLMVPPVAPGVPIASGSKFARPIPADPHYRNTPTAAGAYWGLGPNEIPADRVMELTMAVDRMMKYNAVLEARVKELEGAAVGREQALEEAARALAAANAETERVRAALQAQVVRLQSKIRELEEDDIAFLRAVIEALGKLAPPEKKP